MRVAKNELITNLDNILENIVKEETCISLETKYGNALIVSEKEFDFYRTFYAKCLIRKNISDIKNRKK